MSSINWNVVHEEEFGHGSSTYINMIKGLVDMNILSYVTDGNYMVMGNSVYLNPICHGSFTYFTKRRYAENFVKQVYEDAEYSISIHEL